MHQLSLMQEISVAILPLLFAITLHEVAHGWVARQLGDPTAQLMGRLTLNPIKHIDLIGTIIVPTVLLLMGGFIFGWAKPVPVTWQNLRNPKRDMALVALAGPMANLLMAFIWALIAKIGFSAGASLGMPGQMLVLMGVFGITINVLLMVLNLLPIPPLDGGRILNSFLPGPLSYKFSRLEPYGFLILLALLATGLLSNILGGPVDLVQRVIYTVFGL